MTERLSELPDHELRRRMLDHLGRDGPVSIRVRDLRRMVLDEECGLPALREALARQGL